MKMKIYQTTRTCLALFGFQEDLQPFNKRQKLIFLPCVFFHTANLVQLFHVANTTQEYMDSIFLTTVGTLITASHISTIGKMKTIFSVINKIEEGINQSKCIIFPLLFFLITHSNNIIILDGA